MGDCPRVHEILASSEITKGSQYFKPRFLTRGTIVHELCAIIGRGGTILPDWWGRSSGNIGTQSTPFDDYVPHIECKPYVDAYQRWQLQSGWQPVYFEMEVKNPRGPYRGHIDQVGVFKSEPWQQIILDLKCGGYEPWHRLQVGLYAAAYFNQTKNVARRGCLYLPSGKFVEFKGQEDIAKAYVMVDHHYLIPEFRG